MNTKLLLLALSVSLLSSCVTVPNGRTCSIAGVIQAGANCSWTVAGKEEEMTMQEFLAWLEPSPKDPVTGKPRGGAVCMSEFDYGQMKTALEKACVKLGPACSYETLQVIRGLP